MPRIRPNVVFLLVSLFVLLSSVSCRAASNSDVYQCVKAQGPVVIDGKLDEWKESAAIPCVRGSQRKLQSWNGPEDLRVIAYLMWDNRYFYFAVDVDDDVFCQTGEGKNTWGGDGLQCAFDMAGNGDAIDFQCTIALSPKGGPGMFFTVGGSGRVPGAKVAIRRKVANAGAIYEVAVPWKALKQYRPHAGKIIGFTFLVNDNDGSGRDGWIEWTPGIGDVTEAFFFPRICLVEENDLSDNIGFELALEKAEYEINGGIKGTYYIQSGKSFSSASVAIEVKNKDELLFAKQMPVNIQKGLNTFLFDYPEIKLKAGKNTITAELNVAGIQLVRQENIFVIDKASLPQRIAKLERKYQSLSQLVEKIKAKRLDSSYQMLSLSVGRRFMPGLKKDLQDGKYETVERKVQSLTNSVNKAIKNGSALLVDSSLNMPVPVYDVSKIEIRDGGFFVGKDPVFLFGPVAWMSAHDMEGSRFSELGFNAYEEVYLGPWWLNDDEKTLKRSEMKALTDRLNVAAKQNLSYELLLSLHYLPKWFKDRYPDAWIKDRGNQFLPIILDHPATRKMVKTYLEEVVKQVKDYPALFCYSLINESAYMSYNDYSKYSIAKFKKWLRERHNTIGKLNTLWDTNYNSFAEVQPPPKSTTIPTKQQVNDAIWYDWEMFNEYRYTEFCRWAKSVIRAIDPNTPFMVETNPVPRGGGSGESISLISDISCTDREGTYDFFRSVCPDKPVYDTEFHYDFSPWLPQQYFECEVWKAFLHGCDGMLIWVWNDHRPMSITKEPEKMEGFAKAAMDVQRLGKLVHAFQHNKAEVAILVTNPTYNSRANRFFWFILRDIQEAANGADAHYDIITDRLVDEGKLSDYKILIAYRTDYVSGKNFDKINDFIKNGGYLVLIGKECMRKDAYGKSRNIQALLNNKTQVFHLPVEEIKSASSTSLNKKFSADAIRKLSLQLDDIYKTVKIDRPIVVRNIENKAVPEVEMQMIQHEGRRYAYLINHSEEITEDVVLMEGTKVIVPAKELINNKPITGSVIKLAPMEVVIYELP